jgi:hypothetical protein
MRHRIRPLLLLALSTACGPPPGTVTHEHRGTLADTDPAHEGAPADTYTFPAKRGDKVVIEMTSVDVDAAVILLDSAGNELDRNDDVSTRHRNALLRHYPEKDDTFTVLATRGRAGGTGEYEVEIDVIPRESL